MLDPGTELQNTSHPFKRDDGKKGQRWIGMICGEGPPQPPQIPVSVGQSYIICADQVQNIPLRQQDQRRRRGEEEERGGGERRWHRSMETRPSAPCQVSGRPGWKPCVLASEWEESAGKKELICTSSSHLYRLSCSLLHRFIINYQLLLVNFWWCRWRLGGVV